MLAVIEIPAPSGFLISLKRNAALVIKELQHRIISLIIHGVGTTLPAQQSDRVPYQIKYTAKRICHRDKL